MSGESVITLRLNVSLQGLERLEVAQLDLPGLWVHDGGSLDDNVLADTVGGAGGQPGHQHDLALSKRERRLDCETDKTCDLPQNTPKCTRSCCRGSRHASWTPWSRRSHPRGRPLCSQSHSESGLDTGTSWEGQCSRQHSQQGRRELHQAGGHQCHHWPQCQ